jgi:hypothetical protein
VWVLIWSPSLTACGSNASADCLKAGQNSGVVSELRSLRGIYGDLDTRLSRIEGRLSKPLPAQPDSMQSAGATAPVIPDTGLWIFAGIVTVVLAVLAVLFSRNKDPWLVTIARASAILALITAFLGAAKIATEIYVILYPRPPETKFARLLAAPPILIRADKALPQIPIFFDRNATQSALLHRDGKGTRDSAWITVLEKVMSGLASCGSSKRPVVLHIEGFASSAAFRREKVAVSDEENWDVANLRARGVASFLNDMVEKRNWTGLFKIEARVWESEPEMAVHRPFDDTAGGEAQGTNQQILDRVAMIEFESPGRCVVK